MPYSRGGGKAIELNTEHKRNVDRLCELLGIRTEYRDIFRHKIPLDFELKCNLLWAMGTAADTPPEARESLRLLEHKRWRSVLDPVTVCTQDEMTELIIRLPSHLFGNRLVCVIEPERGESFRLPVELHPDENIGDTITIDGREIQESRFMLMHDFVPGYYRLRVRDERETDDFPENSTTLIIAPKSCHVAGEFQSGRAWGVALQLYALRSADSDPIGDFGDLRILSRELAPYGPRVFGLSPLHALFPANPRHRSPYSPSSRLFWNPVYLDLKSLPEWNECRNLPAIHEALQQSDKAGVADHSGQSDGNIDFEPEIIDYRVAVENKLNLLEILFDHFYEHHYLPRTGRGRAFSRTVALAGRAIRNQALFDTLYEHFLKTRGIFDFRLWPEEYRQPDSSAVRDFADQNRKRLLFYQYLQWNMFLQMRGLGRELREFSASLYFDLAVGANPNGAESWSTKGLFSERASIGAPPDAFSPLGQDWGLAPPIPLAMKEEAYGSFITLIRNNMPRGGVIRLDHIMQLSRLFWIFHRGDRHGGGYVNYPLHDLLGILALESRRRKCTVIGEDLGTVPDHFSEELRRRNIFSWKVLYFEKNEQGYFRPPHEYPVNAVAAVTTHDLPTLNRYWKGIDIRARLTTGRIDAKQMVDLYLERGEDRQKLIQVLLEHGLLSSVGRGNNSNGIPGELNSAVHRFLARTRCRLKIVSLHDLLGEFHQPNLPGTVDEYPNWAYRHGIRNEEITGREESRILLEMLRDELG